ncbi:MAG: hypothetical protein FWD60_07250 [Candidatus Azobacteroides sp.]|nr:hypothetical protein [Candidatus Azobacteroides sp.]
MDENNEQDWANDSENKPDRNQPHDFWKGFGIGALAVVATPLVLIFFMPSLVFTILAYLAFFAYAGAIIVFFVMGRWKFALGLITVFLIPVAIFGGCLLAIGGLRGI